MKKPIINISVKDKALIEDIISRNISAQSKYRLLIQEVPNIEYFQAMGVLASRGEYSRRYIWKIKEESV
jgi:hypothetical protein